MKKTILYVALAALLFVPQSLLAAVIVTLAQGRVEVKKSGTQKWEKVLAPYTLGNGDELQTGRRSKAELLFEDGSKMRLQSRGTFTLEKAEPKLISTFLKIGILEAWFTKVADRNAEIKTPTAVAAVRGTTLSVQQTKRSFIVGVFEGAIPVTVSFPTRPDIKPIPLMAFQRIAIPDITRPDFKVPPILTIPASEKPPEEPKAAPVEEKKTEAAPAPAEEKAPAEEEAATTEPTTTDLTKQKSEGEESGAGTTVSPSAPDNQMHTQ